MTLHWPQNKTQIPLCFYNYNLFYINDFNIQCNMHSSVSKQLPLCFIFSQACTSHLSLLKPSHPSRHNVGVPLLERLSDFSVAMKLLPELLLPCPSNFVHISTQHESHSNWKKTYLSPSLDYCFLL